MRLNFEDVRRKFDGLSSAEQMIVVGICALIDMLEHDVDHYLPVISWVREFYFGRPGRARGEGKKGFIETHEPRARERWK